jgi:outer membrane lipoprotein-sorting protein
MNPTFCRVLAAVILCASNLATSHTALAQETAAALSKEQVLDRWADALGGRENLQNVRTIHLHGTIETGGMKGTYERWATSHGEFRMAVDLSAAFHQVSVFDGHEGWLLDTGGMAHELSGGTLQSVVSAAYEASYSFFFPGRMPGLVDLLGKDASQNAYIFRLEPNGGSPTSVYLDQKTALPQREETTGPMGNRSVSFSDWQNFAGVKIPSKVHQSNGDPKFDVVITTEEVEINTSLDSTLFKKPADTAAQIHFAGGEHEAVIPAELYAQLIFLPVRVNTSEKAWFTLDSGAELSFVSKSWAEKIGLPSGGAIAAKGTGVGSANMGLAKDVVLSLSGVQVPMNSVAVWDFSSILPSLGRRWDGNLGYDVISRFVVRIDYEHQKVTLYDPATFVADDRAAALPLTFVGNLPVVHAKILLSGKAPIDAECAIDSGAQGFHLTAPFANANHVLESFHKTISASSLGAGGRVTREFAGRIDGLQLGPYLLRKPIVAFSPDLKEGLLASSDIGALIGGAILMRFTVTFDYPHQRILLEPNSSFSDPFRDNESGLSLLATGTDFHRFEVDDVEPGSPAATAGVRKGDLLMAIDGHSADEFDVDGLDRTFQQAGRTILLAIGRKGRTLKLRLKLEDRI